VWTAILLAACDLPTGDLPPHVGLFGSARTPPQPYATIVQTILTTTANGRPVSTAALLTVDSASRWLGVRLGATRLSATSDSITITSDTTGLATVAVAFGAREGRAVIRVTVAALGLRDSLVYDLNNGTVSRVRVNAITPAYVGDTLLVAWSTYDQSWTPVFGNPSVTIVDTGIASLVTLDYAIAKRTGITWFRVMQNGATDSGQVTVVPQGSLGALENGSRTWMRFPLNGVGATSVFQASGAFSGPRSSPSGDTLAYADSGHVRLRLPGPTVVRLVPAALGFASEQGPDWSADGSWIYFSGWFADGRSEIWRIHPDGTGAVRVGPAAAAGQYDGEPSVSADGSLLAFTTNRTGGAQPTLQVIATASGTTTYAGPDAAAPRFAPSSARLAFISDGRLVLVSADGSGARMLTANAQYTGQLAWSPDGQWIAADLPGPPSGLYLNVVDTVGDVAIRLPYAFDYVMPDWR